MTDSEAIARTWADIAKKEGSRACLIKIRDDVAGDVAAWQSFYLALRKLMEEYHLSDEQKQDLRRCFESDFGMRAAREVSETPRLKKIRERRRALEEDVMRLEAQANNAAEREAMRGQLIQQEGVLIQAIDDLDWQYRDLCGQQQKVASFLGEGGERP